MCWVTNSGEVLLNQHQCVDNNIVVRRGAQLRYHNNCITCDACDVAEVLVVWCQQRLLVSVTLSVLCDGSAEVLEQELIPDERDVVHACSALGYLGCCDSSHIDKKNGIDDAREEDQYKFLGAARSCVFDGAGSKRACVGSILSTGFCVNGFVKAPHGYNKALVDCPSLAVFTSYYHASSLTHLYSAISKSFKSFIIIVIYLVHSLAFHRFYSFLLSSLILSLVSLLPSSLVYGIIIHFSKLTSFSLLLLSSQTSLMKYVFLFVFNLR